MNSLQIGVVAITALAILATLASGLSQIVSADKDCSVGQELRDKASGNEWGKAISEYAKENQGAGEVFKGYNEFCHSD